MPWHPDWLKAYYRTDRWPERRSAFYRTHKRQCAACGRWQRVQLHHTAYWGTWGDLRYTSSWGKEPDEVLVPLCRGHHRMAHQAAKTKRFESLQTATEEIIRKGRAAQARRRAIAQVGRWIGRSRTMRVLIITALVVTALFVLLSRDHERLSAEPLPSIDRVAPAAPVGPPTVPTRMTDDAER